jgi:myo-inositol 2-dehydrogenase / D-chiro-inositol 1-dehydrogenase
MGDRKKPASTAKENKIDRRKFMAGVGAASLSATVVKASAVRGTPANSKITLGMIGCGMRGKWIGELFEKHGGYRLLAAADYFQDAADEFGDRFNVEKQHRYTTLSGYKRILDQGVDAVVIESPPYFHPEQAAVSIDAGAHVFLAKPPAVDVPGCELIAETGEKATAKNLCFLMDFQTRANEFYKEAVKRAQYGDIGRIAYGEASFNAGDAWVTWNPIARFLEKDPKDPENRLRAWGLDRALSGDIIVEQSIHSIDVASWILDADPVRAYGTGGRRYYKHGDIWDFFGVMYHFPRDVAVLFNGKQFGQGYSETSCRMYGMVGTIVTNYGGDVLIRGAVPYRGGNTGNLYPEGAEANIAEFHENITKKRFANGTVAPSVRSTLASILGRMAAYEGRDVTWEEMMQARETLESDVVKHLKT